MEWLNNILFKPSIVQTVIVISVVSALGLQCGKIKLRGISLGITFVFFIGIIVGHFELSVNKDMLYFAQSFGLILFVYALGLQVGPGFFSSLKKEGLMLNMLSCAVIIMGIAMAISFSGLFHISLPDMMGILSGSVTNTPALGAAQDALKQLFPSDGKATSEMASACAITYPLGVVGVILGAIVMRNFARKEHVAVTKKPDEDGAYVGEFHVTNPKLSGMQVVDIMKKARKIFVISRIWREGKVSIPTSESILLYNDHLLIVSRKSDVDEIKKIFGEQEEINWNKKNIDWNNIDSSHLVSRRIIVTRENINGMKLEDLKLRNIYGINVTRINRAGIELIPTPHLALQIGDKLTVVGEALSISNVAKILGDEVRRLRTPNLIAIFTGITIGLILGTIPIPIPGIRLPVKLGLAAGPIIVGILMGAFGPKFHFTIYTTQSANLLMRQFGIVIYLACLGIDAGSHFFETVLQASGLLWIILGFIITVVPVVLIGILSMKIIHMDYAETIGMLCGSMANPMALDYVNTTLEGNEPSVSYATVYPISMFARIITTELIIVLFI